MVQSEVSLESLSLVRWLAIRLTWNRSSRIAPKKLPTHPAFRLFCRNLQKYELQQHDDNRLTEA